MKLRRLPKLTRRQVLENEIHDLRTWIYSAETQRDMAILTVREWKAELRTLKKGLKSEKK